MCSFVVTLQPLRGFAQQNSDASSPRLQHISTQWIRQLDAKVMNQAQRVLSEVKQVPRRRRQAVEGLAQSLETMVGRVRQFDETHPDSDFYRRDEVAGKDFFLILWSGTHRRRARNTSALGRRRVRRWIVRLSQVGLVFSAACKLYARSGRTLRPQEFLSRVERLSRRPGRNIAQDGGGRLRRARGSGKDGEGYRRYIRCRKRAAPPCAWTGRLRIHQDGTTNRLEQVEAHKSLTMSTDCDDVVTV